MHRHLPLSAARAGDRGELPQQQHATAVRLMGEAVQRASTILSEAVCAQAGGKVLASARLLGTWLRDDMSRGVAGGEMRVEEVCARLQDAGPRQETTATITHTTTTTTTYYLLPTTYYYFYYYFYLYDDVPRHLRRALRQVFRSVLGPRCLCACVCDGFEVGNIHAP